MDATTNGDVMYTAEISRGNPSMILFLLDQSGSMQEVYDYTKTYCDAIGMGVMLFPVPLWNFGRLHWSDAHWPSTRPFARKSCYSVELS